MLRRENGNVLIIHQRHLTKPVIDYVDIFEYNEKEMFLSFNITHSNKSFIDNNGILKTILHHLDTKKYDCTYKGSATQAAPYIKYELTIPYGIPNNNSEII